MNKKKILFVGSFVEKSKTGTVGGQMYACNVLVKSELNESVDWILLDSTAESNLSVSILVRLFSSLKRFIKYIYILFFFNVDSVLIFSGDGLSILEKGTMALLACFLGKHTVFAPRSGFIKNDLEKTIFLKSFILTLFNRVDFVVCQGESWKVYFENFSPKISNKFIVVNNWIDSSKYIKANLYHEEVKIIKIIFLAWVDKAKGIFDLIEAAKHLVKDNNNIKFIIAGHGQDFENTVKLVTEYDLLPFFEFRGWILGDAKVKLLSDCDIFVLPSHAEGFPNALMEAMCSGLAVVATNVGSIKDAIVNGKTGYLIEPKAISELEAALKLLINDKEKRIEVAENAANLIKQEYSLGKAVGIFKKILYK